MPKLKEVFVPGGMPSYTYQDRKNLDLENKLSEALDRYSKFITVAGPTKSGKTVLVRKVIPEKSRIWIEGAHINSINEFLALIISHFKIKTIDTKTITNGKEILVESEANASIKPFNIGGEFKDKDSIKTSNIEATTVQYASSLAQTAVKSLLDFEHTLIIDDFHFVNKEIQTTIIQSLKQAVFDGLKVILVLIPHRMHEAVTAEIDVDGRLHIIQIPAWQKEELFAIAETGVRALNVRMTASTIDVLVSECFESPHLMQDFCSEMCANSKIFATYIGPLKTLDFVNGKDAFFIAIAKNNSSPAVFNALRKGPKRTDRIPRELKIGGSCDTYEAVLIALKEINLVTPVKWVELKRGLQKILINEPQQHEVTRVLEKMDEIAKARDGEPVLDYIKEQGELHLVDPFFRFYVRWGEWKS